MARGREKKIPSWNFQLILFFSLASCQTVTRSSKVNSDRIACEDGDTSKCLALAAQKDRAGDFKSAHYFLTLACESGGRSCDIVGLLDLKSENPAQAVRHWTVGCDLGDAVSCHSMGSFEGKRGNSVIAKKWFRRACEKGVAESCSRLEVPLEEKVSEIGRAELDVHRARDGNAK
jgi:hypothetical protein